MHYIALGFRTTPLDNCYVTVYYGTGGLGSPVVADSSRTC